MDSDNNQNNLPDNSPAPPPAEADFSFNPGAFNALGSGWKRMKANFLVFLLAVFVLAIVQSPMSWQDRRGPDFGDREVAGNMEVSIDDPVRFNGPQFSGFEGVQSLFWLAYFLLLVPVFKYGENYLFLKGVRGGPERVPPKTLFAGFGCYFNVILANILVLGLIILGFIMLVLPGIYVACRLCFTSYLVMDEGMDPIEAVEASWRLTRGHVLNILGLGVMSIFICLGGLALMVVGIFPALMWVKSAFSALYLSISQRKRITS